MAALFLSAPGTLDPEDIQRQRVPMLTALLLFLPVMLALLIAETRLQRLTEGSALQSWLSVHLYLPLMRAGALLLFLFAAYPDLYGLEAAPSLAALLAAGRYRFDQLVNILLILSLLLPLLPLVHRIAGLTLTLQGLFATALVATWLAADSGAAISLLPGFSLALRMVAVLIAARLLAELLAREFLSSPQKRDILVESARLAAQLPAVIIYARYLGGQLGG